MVSNEYKQMLTGVIQPYRFYSIDKMVDEAIEEYLFDNNLYIVDEGVRDWVRSGIIGATMLASTIGGVNAAQAAPSDKPAMQASANIQAKRREAVQLQSNNSSFKKNWSQPDTEGNVLFTKKTESDCINNVLSLKTIEQHDQFIEVIQRHMDELIRVQSIGRSKYEMQQIRKVYDYQFLSYYKMLTITSKFAMEMSE